MGQLRFCGLVRKPLIYCNIITVIFAVILLPLFKKASELLTTCKKYSQITYL